LQQKEAEFVPNIMPTKGHHDSSDGSKTVPGNNAAATGDEYSLIFTGVD